MGEVEAMGEAITGGLVARAVDGIDAAGDRAVGPDGHTQEAACLNCGTPLAGAYCSTCGQHGHIHRTLTAFFHDLLHSVFHFEGRFWNTLPLLVWRPGELTRRYVEGQRARFVSPMALFLFSVFLMFAVLGSLGSFDPIDSGQMRAELRTNVAKEEAKLAVIERERSAALAGKAPTAAIDARLAAQRREVDTLRNLAERGVVSGTAAQMSDDMPKWIREPLDQANRNPELLFYKLRNNAYKWSWALIPLSVPFLWLLFPFSRRFRLYDHMVFVTYSLSFMTLLVITTTLLAAAGWTGAVAVAMFIPTIHMFRQLKGAYGLTRLGALWRTALLTMFALTAAVLFVVMIVGLGLFD
jgi:hypothetical protein